MRFAAIAALLLALVLIVLPFSARAETPEAATQPPQGGTQWSVGVGVIGAPRPYEGARMEVLPVPVLGVRAGPFFFETIRMGVRFADTEHFEAAVLARARFDGYEADDSKALAGMHERRMSADVGMTFTGKWKRVEAGLTAVTDALGRNDGQELAAKAEFPVKAGGWTIKPGVGARWQSDNLVDYYFGVEADEAIAGRPAYEAGAVVNPLVSLNLFKPFAQRKWVFVAQFDYVWLGDEIPNSPIVSESGTPGGYFAFVRTFGAGPRGK